MTSKLNLNAAPGTRPRRIAHVITRLLRAGSEENTIASCIFQAEHGAEVALLHGREYDSGWLAEVGDKVRLIEIPSMVHQISPLSDMLATIELVGFFKTWRPDVVHTHQSKAGVIGRLAAKMSGAPVTVHTVHIAPFMNVGGLTRIAYVCAERLGASLSDRLIDVSDGMREACLANGVGKPEQHVVVRSGMDIDTFSQAKVPSDREARIGGWNGRRPPFVILTLAAFEPRKRQAGFIRALAPILRERPHWCLVFAGFGSEFATCKTLAVTLGVDNQVRFLGHEPKPHELIALSDVCVLASEREGLPRVVIQYLAAGKAIVVANIPGISDVVVHGQNGLIASADLSNIADIIATLDDDRKLLEALANGARSTDVSRWDTAHMGAGIDEVYASVFDSRS